MIRRTAEQERHPLALAGFLWCLGVVKDGSTETIALLEEAVQEFHDRRQVFAAAIALYQIQGLPNKFALPAFRQMAAATWYTESIIVGVPWDYSVEEILESLLEEVEPDPVGATETLLIALDMEYNESESYCYMGIVHDLIELNFHKGDWRKATKLTTIQQEVLRRIVETDDAWRDTKRLWFLVSNGAKMISALRPPDLQDVRKEMRLVLKRSLTK